MSIDLTKYKETKQKALKTNSKSREDSFWKKEITLGKVFNDKVKESFYQEISALLKAGLDIPSSLDVIISSRKKKPQIALLDKIKQNLLQGSSFSESLKLTNAFSNYEYLSIQVGEETGKMYFITEQLSLFFKEKNKIKQLLIKALSYPISVLVMTLLVMIFMLNYVFPYYIDMYKNLNADLPAFTQKMMDVSLFLNHYGIYLLVALVILVFTLFRVRKKEWFKKYSSKIILKMPIWGNMIKKIYLTRAYQLMDLLMASKTPLNFSLDIVSKAIPFYPIEQSFKGINKDIQKGKTIYESMQKYSIFDTKSISLMKVGETSNQLDTMFHNLSENFKNEVDTSIHIMQTALSQVLMYVVGAIVLIMLIGMYMPMIKITDFL